MVWIGNLFDWTGTDKILNVIIVITLTRSIKVQNECDFR